jgi:DNA-binding NtrC family response regulator
MLLHGERIYHGSAFKEEGEVRVICASAANLINLVENGSFSGQLYYELSVIKLELKPLRERPEDIPGWITYWMNIWQKKYERYVHLSDGTRKTMEKYEWPGNLQQLSSICQKIVILSDRHEADELFVNQLLEQSYPVLLKMHDQNIVVFQDKKAVEINELLYQFKGNREKVAEALGVSKTTLWRYMKKFGISRDE